MNHFGAKEVTPKEEPVSEAIGVRSQRAEARKPLMVVRRRAEKNQVVQFGHELGRN